MPKKLLLVILSAILMPVVASAQSFLVDYFPVLVYGDTDIYKQVFNGVAVMFNNKTTVGFVTNVVGILAFIMIVWRLTFKHGSAGGGETGSAPWEMFFKQFAFLCIIMFVFLNPAFKSTVTIKDQRAFFGKQTIGGGATIVKVDNVPTVLAFVASGTSYLGYALVNLVDTAFASSRINSTRYSDVGFMTNFRLLSQGIKLGEGDPKEQEIQEENKFIDDARNFVKNCAFKYQALTGDKEINLNVGETTLAGLDPAKWKYKGNIGFLEAAPGIKCQDYYNDLMNTFQKFEKKFEERSIRAMGLDPLSARPALKAMSESVLAAPNNVAGHKSAMNGYTQYHLKSSIDSVVGQARYADSLGVTGANAEAINQSLNSAQTKMIDITSQARFLFSAQTLPKALHILIAILYAIFPFMLVVVAIRGYPEGLKVLYYFAGGMLSMELIKMSLALVHNLVSYITATDGATLLSAASNAIANGNGVDYNKVIHGEKYYQYMAEQATLAADIGTAAMFMIPMVIATGQVKLLGSALGGAVSGHAPNQDLKGAHAEMAKANDAENRGMDSVVDGYSTAAVMKGIEENNAAIASISKMDYYNDFNKGQVGQQMQQIGSVAGYGSELKSPEDFQNVLDGGRFQGVQSVSNMKSLGKEFVSEQNFKYSEDSNGRALARTLGNDATAKTIGSARGLLAGDFFDKDGNLKDNREGNLYTQGLENQARISANQTAGVGKLGEFTREQMNAIQYGAEAGALGQIAQGNALRAVHGTGQGFQDSYSKTAYMNAHQSLSQQKGSAQAYDSETHGGSIKIAESMGRVNNATALRGHSLSVSAHGSESSMIGANAGDAMEKAFVQSAEHSAKVSAGVRDAKGRMDMGSDYALGKHAQALAQTGKEIGDAENFASGAAAAANELVKKAEMAAGENAQSSTLKKATDNVGTVTDAMLLASPATSLAAAANLAKKHLLGGESIGDKAQASFNNTALKKSIDNTYNQEVAQDKGVKRARGVEQAIAEGDFVSMGALSTSQRFSMSAGSVFGDMNVNSSGGMQGSFQSGVSFSHNESRNYSFSINFTEIFNVGWKCFWRYEC